MGDLTKNLSTYEYLPKKEYELYKAGRIPARTFILLIRPELIKADQAFIDRYGSTVINDWHWGGGFQYSGFRPCDCDVGSNYGDHRFGLASDKKPQKVTIEEVFNDIKKNPDLFIAMGYMTIEDISLAPTWFHGSVASYLNQDGLFFIK